VGWYVYSTLHCGCFYLKVYDFVSAESFVGKGQHFKGMRRHARMRMGEIRYQFNHYYIKLEEGKPPKHFYDPKPTGDEMLQKWMEHMRSRHIGVTI